MTIKVQITHKNLPFHGDLGVKWEDFVSNLYLYCHQKLHYSDLEEAALRKISKLQRFDSYFSGNRCDPIKGPVTQLPARNQGNRFHKSKMSTFACPALPSMIGQLLFSVSCKLKHLPEATKKI